MLDDILIGKEQKIRLINGLIGKKKNIIIFGSEGVGKTAVVNELLKDKGKEGWLYSHLSSTLKESLANLLLCAGCDKKSLDNANILTLKKMFYETLKTKNPGYIVFDHVGKVAPKFYSLLEYLMDKGIPLIMVSRGLDRKHIGHLWIALCAFEKVRIYEMDKPTAYILTEHFIRGFKIKIPKESEFKKNIFSYSNGIPKVIKTLCQLAKDEKYNKRGAFDVKLMDLDRKISRAIK